MIAASRYAGTSPDIGHFSTDAVAALAFIPVCLASMAYHLISPSKDVSPDIKAIFLRLDYTMQQVCPGVKLGTYWIIIVYLFTFSVDFPLG